MLITLITVWNIIVFLMYGYDKHQSKNGGWRVSEKYLLASALLSGGIGAFMGMEFFRHKTKHLNFKLLVSVGAFITIYIYYCLI